LLSGTSGSAESQKSGFNEGIILMNFDLTNLNLLFPLLGVIVAILGISFAVYGISTWLKRGNSLSTRMDEFVAAEVQPLSNPITGQILPREITGSLFSRTIVSWFKKFIQFLERLTPEKMAIDMEHQLMVAGNPGNMHAGQFFAMRLMVLLAGIFLAFLINWDYKKISITSFMFGILVIVIFYFLPAFWLKSRIQSKQFEIRRELPNALDMLSVCADAGLGFDQSLQKISVYWDTELGHELKRVTQELEMGVSRTDALKNMSNRLDVEDLSRFISIVIQAETIGMSYADVLHSQALQMRVLRQYWAREIANKLPAKMILPLALCIFPALIAVIIGPIIPTITNIF
jgi:tight adherence protein C